LLSLWQIKWKSCKCIALSCICSLPEEQNSLALRSGLLHKYTMPRSATPLQVGTFVLVALFLGLGMLLFFSTTTLFTSTQTYILYFQDSVKGLSVGSAVKYKGVPIGQVKKIYISYNQPTNSARIPVLIQIESEELSQMAALRKVPVGDVLKKEVNNGLRAQLELESFITGLLSVNLDYFPNSGPPEYIQQTHVYNEIPTTPGAFSQLGNSANDLVAKLDTIDFKELAINLKNLAGSLNRAIEKTDPKSIPGILASFDSVMKQASDKQFGSSLGDLTKNLSRATAEKGELTECLKSLRGASQHFAGLSQELSSAVRGDSAAGAKLYRLMDSLTEASESLSRLADYLEQNPNAIFTGRQSTTE